MEKHILVIGGRGFLGKRVCEALQRDPLIKVARGGRSAPVRIDLNEMSTFPAMDRFDVIVNCSDSLRAPPDRAILYALNRGLTFFETSGDAQTIARLLEQKRRWHIADDGGRAIVGLGLFPGITNLMAASAADRTPDCQQLEIAIALTPLSGAGRGTANLMAAAFDQPARGVIDGKLHQSPSLAAGPRLRFGKRARKTVTVGLAEPEMLAATTGVPNVAGYLAPPPGLYPLVRLSGMIRPRGGLLRRMYLRVVRGGVRVLRGVFLRWKSARVELTAIANGSTQLTVRVRDGFEAAGQAVAAAVNMLAGKSVAPGFYLPDAVFTLEETLSTMRESGATVELLVTAPESSESSKERSPTRPAHPSAPAAEIRPRRRHG